LSLEKCPQSFVLYGESREIGEWHEGNKFRRCIDHKPWDWNPHWWICKIIDPISADAGMSTSNSSFI